MNRIAMLRKEKGLSQISLSLKLNVSQKMISAYENGKSEPSIATLMQMADICDWIHIAFCEGKKGVCQLFRSIKGV